MQKELIEIGLTQAQANVYLELNKNPEQTAGKIAKTLSLDRSFTYGILTNLIDKGLVNYITKENKRLFYPSDPDNLIKEINEKRDRIKKVIKELKSIKKQRKQQRSVNVYEGKAGLKAYVRDFLQSKTFYTLGGGGKLNILEALKYEYPHYLKDFKKKNIKGKLITSKDNKKIMQNLYGDKVKIKILKNLDNQVTFTIFKNKLAIYSAQGKPFVIMIQDKDISKALKDYFDELWEVSKK